MFNEFKLEVANTCEALGLLEGDEIVYSSQITPRSNGKDLAILEIKGEMVVAAFTKFGSQYIIMGDSYQVYKHHQVRVIGKVVDSMDKIKKPTGSTVDLAIQSTN